MPSFATQEPDRYLDVIPAKQIAAILEGPEVLGHPVNNLMDLDEVVAQGIPRGAFDALVDQLAAHSREVARVSLRYRIVPWGTYQRSRRLNQQHSETVERIARILGIARALWGDDEAVCGFLLSPHPELNGKTPLDASLTEIGGRQVEEIVERVMRGLPV